MLTNTRINLYISQAKSASLIHLAASGFVVSGLLGISFPSLAATIPTSTNRNAYRLCASRLVGAGTSAEAAATACAGALNPQDVARCVVQIEGQTEIAAPQALDSCRQVRRPIELSSCVVGISNNIKGSAVPGVLDYCTRSLLPQRYAECVVGLGREINLAPNRALETCISSSDRPLEFSPNFIPREQFPPDQQLTPTPNQSQNQTPQQPATTPTEPQNQTPAAQPQNQTAPAQPAPAPTTP